ncbi:testicular haploid expressed gene protein-like [Melanaphis sacchari]|uniref:testicular haploid expressed gene protein-like n=1 Tax=Melanaphis sacchari TaxID=742174 RepID=UPI000DC13C7A|nr:testicular haploid expressed gene protein-like [Melanaphis sacchari]
MTNHYDENEILRALGVSSNNLVNNVLKTMICSVQRHDKRSKRMGFNNIYRIVRREMLSRPMCRKLRPWPDPRLEGPFVISPAALKAKLTDRLEYLALPKKENVYWESYYSSTVKPEKYKNKNKIISGRLIELSQPKPFIDDIDKKIVRTHFKSKTEWLAYLEKLKIFGAARRPPPSPLEPKRIKKPLKSIVTYLELLSQPVNRPQNTNEKTIEELNTIKSSALKYNASDRIKKLAVAKQLNEQTLMDLNYDPRDKLINAKKYIATDRIKELSIPKVRETPKKIEVKTDAFSVNPNALKAWCSPRIKRLAKPIIRD